MRRERVKFFVKIAILIERWSSGWWMMSVCVCCGCECSFGESWLRLLMLIHCEVCVFSSRREAPKNAIRWKAGRWRQVTSLKSCLWFRPTLRHMDDFWGRDAMEIAWRSKKKIFKVTLDWHEVLAEFKSLLLISLIPCPCAASIDGELNWFLKEMSWWINKRCWWILAMNWELKKVLNFDGRFLRNSSD